VLGIGALVHALVPTDLTKQANLSRRRFIVTIGVLVVAWAAVVFDIYYHRSEPAVLSGGVLLSWAGGAPNQCFAIVDGSQLARWKDQFRVIVACGLLDPRKDRFRNDRITISAPFTIAADQIIISTPFSQLMIREIKDTFPQQIAHMKANQLLGLASWIEAAVIPNDCDITTVRTLSNIKLCGGQLLDVRSDSVEYMNEKP